MGSNPITRTKILTKEIMQIQIVNVDVSTPTGKKYQMAEVIFKSNGETKTKKIMSFANPSVFGIIKDAKKDDTFTITQEKDGQGYWQWTTIKSGSGEQQQQNATQSAAPQRSAATMQRDFETKEERADRQRLIVRQSSLSNSIAILSPGSKSALDPKAVLALAEELVAWVTSAPAIQPFEDMKDDFPF